jgi:hypothetical protein
MEPNNKHIEFSTENYHYFQSIFTLERHSLWEGGLDVVRIRYGFEKGEVDQNLHKKFPARYRLRQSHGRDWTRQIYHYI